MKQKNKFLGSRISLYAQRTLIYSLLILMSVIIIFIFYILIINSTRNHVDIQKGISLLPGGAFKLNFDSLIKNQNLKVFTAMRNSLFIALTTAILTTYFSALTAYGIHMYKFKGKKFVHMFIIGIMMVPSQIASIGLVTILYSVGWVDNYWVLILPAIASPATFFFMKQYLQSVLPNEIVESGRMDGASEIGIFHKLVLPIISPALAVQFIFSFVASWNNLFMPNLVLTSQNKRTIPIIISQLTSSSPERFDMGPVYMIMFFAIVPMLIIYLIFSRKIIKGVTLGSVKG
ncbi:carbohydrate ABC transporter permease [Haploplasma axanthum]|uniref:Inner membrane ABC transporter permease protein ycjP n=1 Tax=Haploplasma axanthum TaxID=29552 RepID=A0A449BF73_HAPAX|nr:carbohydrate ABC transporter permease [Haploplasma axanthum]VEU81104.1 Inner membrane ABC transporter permease protein ycjP [Haploplasma axanthum]